MRVALPLLRRFQRGAGVCGVGDVANSAALFGLSTRVSGTVALCAVFVGAIVNKMPMRVSYTVALCAVFVGAIVNKMSTRVSGTAALCAVIVAAVVNVPWSARVVGELGVWRMMGFSGLRASGP